MNFAKLFKYGKRLFLYGVIWCLVHVAVISIDGFIDDDVTADYAIVLGNKVEMTARPSVRLQTRLDKALELYKEGKVKKVIVSGGLGYEGFEEADIMKIYLEKKRIPAKDVIADRNGYTTYLTAKSCSEMIGDPSKSIIVVTHYYHIARTKLAFKRFGTQTVHGAHADLNMEWIEPYAIFREFVAFYYYLLRRYPPIS